MDTMKYDAVQMPESGITERRHRTSFWRYWGRTWTGVLVASQDKARWNRHLVRTYLVMNCRALTFVAARAASTPRHRGPSLAKKLR